MEHEVLRFPPSHWGNGSSLQSSLAWPDGDEWDKRKQEERKLARQEWLHIQCFGEDTRMHGPGIAVKTDSRRQMTSNLACFPCFTFGRCWEENWNGGVKMSKWFHSIQYVLLSWHTVSLLNIHCAVLSAHMIHRKQAQQPSVPQGPWEN